MPLERDIINSYEDIKRAFMEELKEVSHDIAYKTCHVDTGLLRSTLESDITEDSVELSLDTEYAIFEELRYHTLENALTNGLTTLKAKYDI